MDPRGLFEKCLAKHGSHALWDHLYLSGFPFSFRLSLTAPRNLLQEATPNSSIYCSFSFFSAFFFVGILGSGTGSGISSLPCILVPIIYHFWVLSFWLLSLLGLKKSGLLRSFYFKYWDLGLEVQAWKRSHPQEEMSQWTCHLVLDSIPRMKRS